MPGTGPGRWQYKQMLRFHYTGSREKAWLEIGAALGAAIALSLSMYQMEFLISAGSRTSGAAFGAFVVAVIVSHDSRGRKAWVGVAAGLLAVGAFLLIAAFASMATQLAGL